LSFSSPEFSIGGARNFSSDIGRIVWLGSLVGSSVVGNLSAEAKVKASAAACYTFQAYFRSDRTTEDGIDKRFIRMNERIRAREVRVIGDEGEQIGIMAPFDALKMARERNLDLVEISPTAQPPVCRIMDYGKFLYQNEKREREAKKKQKTITVKEVKFRINVDDHDYETKKNHVLRFLDEGDKVKATIFFRGREMTRQSLGRQILERLIKDVDNRGLVEFRPRQEGNTLHLILAPKKDAGGGPKEKPAPPKAATPPPQGGAQTA
jgi:translation initiation factor IF-3